MDEPPDFYSLNEAAELFRMRLSSFKRRLHEFVYTVDEKGNYRITRESILEHLEELQKRNNRIN